MSRTSCVPSAAHFCASASADGSRAGSHTALSRASASWRETCTNPHASRPFRGTSHPCRRACARRCEAIRRRAAHVRLSIGSEETHQMTLKAMQWLTAGVLVATLATPLVPNASASCGCDKPPPPRAAVRPFVGQVDETITLFDDRIVKNDRYTVLFQSRDGRQDWSRAKGVSKRDFADGEWRSQLRVEVGNVSMGPVAISVYD